MAGETQALPEVNRLRDLTGQQWKSGAAAWLGWLFDGLDMHLYTLVAIPFVAQLLTVPDSNPEVKWYSSWIQAAFLIGWALGGGFFGRVGDRLGRTQALSLTIVTYALFTGLSFFAQTWWQLLIFRFVAALGIGGEWAVGAALLSETWPRNWRPWIAAVLQTGVNIGVLLAAVVVYVLAGEEPRWVFLAGVLPALLVLWIRRAVPEPAEWHTARAQARGQPQPGILDLFAPQVRRTTFLTILVCSLTLTAHWAFMFWFPQQLRDLPDTKDWSAQEKQELVSTAWFLAIATSTAGNFLAGFLAKLLSFRTAIVLMCLGYGAALLGVYAVPRTHTELLWMLPIISLFHGLFALFTMYMPPLFPTLLRTTGAGFCYNIGRIAAALGTVFFGMVASVSDYRLALFFTGFLFVPAVAFSLILPESGQRSR